MITHIRFFPAGGVRAGNDGRPVHRGLYGFYWSSSIERETHAWRMRFNHVDSHMAPFDRSEGSSLRCVACSKDTIAVFNCSLYLCEFFWINNLVVTYSPFLPCYR